MKMYTGERGGIKSFKQRYNNHLSIFRHQKYENSTGILKYIWKKRRDNEECDVKSSIVQQTKPSSNMCKHCNLCTTETLKISDEDKSISPNKYQSL